MHVKYLENYKVQSQQTHSHRKHRTWNASSVVPLLILWFCDVTLRHHVTHFHNLCLAACLAHKNWLSTAALSLFEVLGLTCMSWPIRAEWFYAIHSETVPPLRIRNIHTDSEAEWFPALKGQCEWGLRSLEKQTIYAQSSCVKNDHNKVAQTSLTLPVCKAIFKVDVYILVLCLYCHQFSKPALFMYKLLSDVLWRNSLE